MATQYYLLAITLRDGEGEKPEHHMVEAELCRYCHVPIVKGAMQRRHEQWHAATNTDRRLI